MHVAADNEVAAGVPYLPAAHIVPAQVDAPVVSKIVKESVMNECANLLSFDNKVTVSCQQQRQGQGWNFSSSCATQRSQRVQLRTASIDVCFV